MGDSYGRVMTLRTLPVITAAVLVLAACGGGSDSSSSELPQESEMVELDPSDFTTEIDNPYWPMRPGSHWVYRETDGEGGVQRVDVTVTEQTKVIDGIGAVVVHDLVTEKGEKVEDTLDWYAQDNDGNVWYLGEDTKEFENGKVTSTEGSWEHGVDGAQAGIIVPAEPKQGLAYREEYYEGEAEDAAEVLSVEGKVDVPFGFFRDATITRNYSGIEPKVEELKFYARGVGPVLELLVSGGSGRAELLTYEKG
jgi:hypothetical protein